MGEGDGRVAVEGVFAVGWSGAGARPSPLPTCIRSFSFLYFLVASAGGSGWAGVGSAERRAAPARRWRASSTPCTCAHGQRSCGNSRAVAVYSLVYWCRMSSECAICSSTSRCCKGSGKGSARVRERRSSSGGGWCGTTPQPRNRPSTPGVRLGRQETAPSSPRRRGARSHCSPGQGQTAACAALLLAGGHALGVPKAPGGGPPRQRSTPPTWLLLSAWLSRRVGVPRSGSAAGARFNWACRRSGSVLMSTPVAALCPAARGARGREAGGGCPPCLAKSRQSQGLQVRR